MAKASKTKQRVIPQGTVQENFNIKISSLEKVKDLAHKENTSKTDIYNRSVEKYLELYEKKNGSIPKRPTGKGLEKL